LRQFVDLYRFAPNVGYIYEQGLNNSPSTDRFWTLDFCLPLRLR